MIRAHFITLPVSRSGKIVDRLNIPSLLMTVAAAVMEAVGGRVRVLCERAHGERVDRRINLRRAMAPSHVLSWRGEYLISVDVFVNERARAEQTRPPGRMLLNLCLAFFSKGLNLAEYTM